MPINSPIPVRLEDECRKAAKILRSFARSKDMDFDKVVPQSILERAAGFAIFTVIKAGFVFSARAGSGVVIARTSDGNWSAPSAIGLGGVGFGGQLGAEVTDFLIVLNSRAAVNTFMSAGQLTLGGNLSVAVGPLGRNAEGSGAVNAKGKIAAMYSYSKTRGLFGGVSVEGSVIVERQDANRLAYGSTVSAKALLSGSLDAPNWAGPLIHELEATCGSGRSGRYGNGHDDGNGYGNGSRPGWSTFGDDDERRYNDENGFGHVDDNWNNDAYMAPSTSKKGGRSRSGSNASGSYAFSEGLAAQGSQPTTPTKSRSRSGSLFGKNDGPGAGTTISPGRDSPRPGIVKRASGLNPFSSSSNAKKGAAPPPSSESYNAGLTWDSSGPMGAGGRSRSSSNAQRPGDFDDLLGDWGDKNGLSNGRQRNGISASTSMGSHDDGLSNTFSKLSTNGTHSGNRSRSGSNRAGFENIAEDEYVPFESESRFAKLADGRRSPITNANNRTKSSLPPSASFSDPLSRFNGKNRPASSYTSSSSSPFGGDVAARQPFDDYFDPPSRTKDFDPFPDHSQSSSHDRHRSISPAKPSLALRPGLDRQTSGSFANIDDSYARAVALYEFKSQQAGDLGLVKGDVVVIYDKVGAKGDWWKGMKVDGSKGIFPKSYVEVLGIPKPLKGGVDRMDLKARMATPFE